VAPIGNGRLLRSAGIRPVEEIDWWQSASAAPLPVALTLRSAFLGAQHVRPQRALWAGS